MRVCGGILRGVDERIEKIAHTCAHAHIYVLYVEIQYIGDVIRTRVNSRARKQCSRAENRGVPINFALRRVRLAIAHKRNFVAVFAWWFYRTKKNVSLLCACTRASEMCCNVTESAQSKTA